jgi:uncharacterized protein (DUF1697 family)
VACHIALLRAVNISGRNGVAMASLRDLATALGFKDARTLLQSGNLVFRADRRSAVQVERLFEREAASRFAVHTDFFVRTGAEWQTLIAGNPFRAEAARDPGHLVVVALKSAPSSEHLKALRAAIKGRELVELQGRHAFIVFPDGIGRSKLTTTIIERTLGTRGTARNWNTVLKLEAMALKLKTEN